jgi:hypothetical protein
VLKSVRKIGWVLMGLLVVALLAYVVLRPKSYTHYDGTYAATVTGSQPFVTDSGHHPKAIWTLRTDDGRTFSFTAPVSRPAPTGTVEVEVWCAEEALRRCRVTSLR